MTRLVSKIYQLGPSSSQDHEGAIGRIWRMCRDAWVRCGIIVAKPNDLPPELRAAMIEWATDQYGRGAMGDRRYDAHVLLYQMAQRQENRRARDVESQRHSKLQKWMADGGQRAIRSGAKAEVFTKVGQKLERESPGGEQTEVSHLLDPRLLLSDRQRATGNCFGAYAQAVGTSGQTAFLREYVDRSVSSSSGATERHLHMTRMVAIAEAAAKELAPITYPKRSRGLGTVGPHRPVKAVTLLHAICRDGYSLSYVGLTHGWTAERMAGKAQGKIEVPVRQRADLGEALRCVLDAVYDAWDSKGYALPYEFMRLVTK